MASLTGARTSAGFLGPAASGTVAAAYGKAPPSLGPIALPASDTAAIGAAPPSVRAAPASKPAVAWATSASAAWATPRSSPASARASGNAQNARTSKPAAPSPRPPTRIRFTRPTKPWRAHVVKCTVAHRAMSPPDRATWDEYFMRIAEEVASRATCDRKHVGAVIVRDKSILATGYNGSIRGLAHCDEEGHLHGGRPLRAHHPRRGQRHHPSCAKRRPHRGAGRSTSPPRRAGVASR